MDSPDPSEGDCKDGKMLEQQVMITVAQHPTKVVMHLELVKAGHAEEEVPILQMAAEAMEETEMRTDK